MAIQHTDIIDIDLNCGNIHRTFAFHAIGAGDYEANIFGVRMFRDREPVLPGTSCIGYFVRADGVTVMITGVIEGNTAYVSLPAQCYTVEGNFCLAIKTANAETSETVRIVDGMVCTTSTDACVDPGGVVPNVAGLEEKIAAINAAADEIAKYNISNQQIEGTRYKIIATKTT